MLLVDATGKIVLANEHACILFGRRVGELNGQPITELLPERFRAAHAGYLGEFARDPQMREMGRGSEFMACRADGSEFPVEVSLNPYKTASAVYTLVSVRAIAEPKASESRIRHLNRVVAMQSQINALILNAQDCDTLYREACQIAVKAGVFSMAWIGLLETANGELQVVARFGKDVETYLRQMQSSGPLSRGPAGAAIREDRPVWIENGRTARREEEARACCYGMDRCSSALLPLRRREEAVGVLAMYANDAVMFDAEERRLLTDMASNLSFAMDRLERERTLKRLVDDDSLTGLGNRAWFLSRITHHLRRAARERYKVAILLLDVERFKNINEGLGQATGNVVLKQVAAWLTREMGDSHLLARLDADHFAVMMPRVERVADVELQVEHWMSELREQTFGPTEDPFRISMKVGISIYPEDGVKASILFHHAEAALRQAKASRNRYLFYARKMSEMMAGKFVLENQLRLALEREEFVVHYQPKMNMVTGEICGAEALIRWDDPHTGLVQPNRFIPMLEETGLICDVGRWALHKALEDALRWRRTHGMTVRVAVNVSPLQLRSCDFLHDIQAALTPHPEAAACLELEVTEGMVMEDIGYSIEILQAIRAMGVTIAIDDFGTGFSSLSYLSKLPLDTLKIDRSFVVDLSSGTTTLSQISAIINLAHSMGLKVIAEGVETEEQSRLLRMLGCNEMQGFLFSKPLPCAVFESRFLNRSIEPPLLPMQTACRAEAVAG